MVVPDRRQRLAGGNPPTDLNRNVPLKTDDQRSVTNRNVSLDQEPFRVSSNLVIREGYRPPMRSEPIVEGKGKVILIDQIKEGKTILNSLVITEQEMSSVSVLEVNQGMEMNDQEKQDQVCMNLKKATDQDKENLEEALKRNDGIAVKLNNDKEVSNSQILKKSLVVKVLGSNIPFSVCSQELFPGLPLSCWDEENIPLIASTIGTPMMLDGNSFKWGKREYARCCTREKLVQERVEVLKQTEAVNVDGVKERAEEYGPWIHVKFRDRRVRNTKRGVGASNLNKQSFRPEDSNKQNQKDIPIGVNKFQALEGDLEEGELNEKENSRLLEKTEHLNQSGNKAQLEVGVPAAVHALEDQMTSFSNSAIGVSGGILLMWKKDTASFEVLNHSSQLIMGTLNVNNMGKWNIATVYGSNDAFNRKSLWQQREDCMIGDDPGIIGGYFNCILSKEDKRGGEGSTSLMVRHLPRVASDHTPIAISLVEPQKQNFVVLRFEDTWKSYPDTWNTISKAWKKMDFGTNAEILQRMLRRSLKSLYYRNKNKCKELNSLKEELKKDILQLQIEEPEMED
ncbi:hypothetical protein KFK09_014886 [Dendrobium nobile]|uniref:Uncharacterized protein n=1 Tax=Dendrobium nobile TaxID=94219 RepID=A0A8T3B3B1_DENNO|nr:hypothetical protein KFK09_014886 [Dendrobium nobile]